VKEAMVEKDAYHEGEIALQERAGERAVALRNGAMITAAVRATAHDFLSQQRTVAVATHDDEGRLWASLWFGAPGFVTTEDGHGVTIAPLPLLEDDPVCANLRIGRDLGMLAIELGSRRRLRINGHVDALTRDRADVVVRESFPNCPKYIQRRQLVEDTEGSPSAPSTSGVLLDEPRRALIQRTDTLFVASRHPERGADASHRGGGPGFVHVLDDHTLRIPDYPGNSMFQTLGNLAIEPRAGLVMVDFARGRLLSLTGTTRLSFGVEPQGHPTGGTARAWELSVDRWVEYDAPTAHRWKWIDSSPFNPPASW
jgi:predicted pyridoxine 5'-phosphate oxidase superfamily flavin-nucleotide-binding protein